MALAVPLRAQALANSRFITSFPRSALRASAGVYGLKLLPVDLPDRPWSAIVVTLKNRTLSPVVERFIECVREVALTIVNRAQSRT
jgi:DNA-binding transcriptional LysR family regulator